VPAAGARTLAKAASCAQAENIGFPSNFENRFEVEKPTLGFPAGAFTGSQLGDFSVDSDTPKRPPLEALWGIGMPARQRDVKDDPPPVPRADLLSEIVGLPAAAWSLIAGEPDSLPAGTPDFAVEEDALAPLMAVLLRMVVAVSALSMIGYACFKTGRIISRRIAHWFDARALGVRRVICVEDINPDDVLHPAEVHDRGWSLDLMLKVLGPPDYAVVDPAGISPPLIFVSRKRVEALEKSKAFRAFQRSRGIVSDAQAVQASKWMRLREGYATYAEGHESA
jgi:hypothetical protein